MVWVPESKGKCKKLLLQIHPATAFTRGNSAYIYIYTKILSDIKVHWDS